MDDEGTALFLDDGAARLTNDEAVAVAGLATGGTDVVEPTRAGRGRQEASGETGTGGTTVVAARILGPRMVVGPTAVADRPIGRSYGIGADVVGIVAVAGIAPVVALRVVAIGGMSVWIAGAGTPVAMVGGTWGRTIVVVAIGGAPIAAIGTVVIGLARRRGIWRGGRRRRGRPACGRRRRRRPRFGAGRTRLATMLWRVAFTVALRASPAMRAFRLLRLLVLAAVLAMLGARTRLATATAMWFAVVRAWMVFARRLIGRLREDRRRRRESEQRQHRAGEKDVLQTGHEASVEFASGRHAIRETPGCDIADAL